jgi:hypothetical protein
LGGRIPVSMVLYECLVTTVGLFDYTFNSFVDQVSDSVHGGMLYSNTVIQNCTISELCVKIDGQGIEPVFSSTADSLEDDYGSWEVCP